MHFTTPRPVSDEEARRRFKEIRAKLSPEELPLDTKAPETADAVDPIIEVINSIEKRRREDPAYDKKVRKAQESVDGPETP